MKAVNILSLNEVFLLCFHIEAIMIKIQDREALINNLLQNSVSTSTS